MNNWQIRLSNLSKYRKELMGISIIFIMLCHAGVHRAELPRHMINILSFFNIGVEIFLFLSGFGIYYSLANMNSDGALSAWYKKRFTKILVPYFIMESPFWLIYCIYHGLGIIGFFYYISFLSYWYEGIGAWFLVLLLPLYIISPFLFKLLYSRYRNIWLVVLIILVLLISILGIPFHDKILHHIVFNLEMLASRVPSFILGMYLGREIRNDKKVSFKFIFLFLFLFMAMRYIPFLSEIFRAWLITVPISLFLVLIFKFLDTVKGKCINNLLAFLGERTLEIYIFYDISVNTIQWIVGKGDVLYYGSMILGLVGGILYKWISSNIGLVYRKGMNIWR